MICLFGIYICRCTGFCLSLVNYVDMSVIFVVDCVLRLSLTKKAVCFRYVLCGAEFVCDNGRRYCKCR
jgi:hypothetical protein